MSILCLSDYKPLLCGGIVVGLLLDAGRGGLLREKWDGSGSS